MIENCPDRVDIFNGGSAQPIRMVCGCGECPEPDLTPEQMMSKVSSMIENQWTKVLNE